MGREREGTEKAGPSGEIEPLLIRREEVLELLDRALRREVPLSEAYLFAVDVVEGCGDGTARLEDPGMLDAIAELATLSVLTHDIIDEIRQRLHRPSESGTA